MAKLWIVAIFAAVLAVGAYLLFANKSTSAPVTSTTNTVIKTNTVEKTVTERTITLSEQNGSGEKGSAVLSEKDGKVTVTLDMVGFQKDVSQPAHIHLGSCPDVGAVAYPLTNVVNGKSVTVLDTTLAKLDAKLPLGLNVHKSAAESKVYVSCGNLGPEAATTSSTPTPTPTPSTSPTPTPTASPTPSPSASPN